MSWLVYILRCGDGTLYTGITNDLEARLLAHEQGKGAKYTRGRGPFVVVYRQKRRDRGSALRREAAIKGLSKNDKQTLIAAQTQTPPKRGRLPKSKQKKA
jgi:predicted GIY-YIG superfamily endonuclease